MKFFPKIRLLALSIGIAIGVLSVAILATLAGKTTLYELTNDVVAAAFEATGYQLHPLTGVLTMLGIFAWSATVAILLFAAFLITNMRSKNSPFLVTSAALTSLLLFSDAFMAHEFMMGYYFGLPEEAMFAVIALCTMIWAVVFQRSIREVGPGLLVIGLGLFVISLIVDSFPTSLGFLGDWYYLAEEGSKWVGIVMWLGFHVQSAITFVDNAIEARMVTV